MLTIEDWLSQLGLSKYMEAFVQNDVDLRALRYFDIKPERLAGDTAYGSGANLKWLVKDKDIAPHIPVIDKSKREDGTFSREDFTFDKDRNVYICPANRTNLGVLSNEHVHQATHASQFQRDASKHIGPPLD